MGGKQSRMTDKQHGKPDKKGRKSSKHSRLADKHNGIEDANTHGGITGEQTGPRGEHDGMTATVGTIHVPQSDQSGLTDMQDGVTDRLNGMTNTKMGTTVQDGVTGELSEINERNEIPGTLDGTTNEQDDLICKGEVTDTHGATVNTQSEVNDSEVTNRMNDYEDASKCQLVKGIELSSKVKNCPKTCQDELKLDPHHLKPILNEIFRHCSTMIISFPSHNYAQVKKYAESILPNQDDEAGFPYGEVQVTTEALDITTLKWDQSDSEKTAFHKDASTCKPVIGIELSSKGKTCQDELKLHPHHLKPILNELFRHCSTMIISLPSHNYAQMKKYAESILPNQDDETKFPHSEVQVTALELGITTLERVIIEETSVIDRIKSVFHSVDRGPTISHQGALKVDDGSVQFTSKTGVSGDADATLLYRVQYFSIHKSSEESHWRTLWIDTVSGNPFTLDKSNTSKNGTTTTPTTYKLIAKSPPQENPPNPASSTNLFDWLSASTLENEDFQNNYLFKHKHQSGGIVIKFANKWKQHDTKDYVVGKSGDFAVLQSSNATIFKVVLKCT